VQFNDAIEKDFGHYRGVKSTRAKQEVAHFRKAGHKTRNESCFL